MDYSNDLFKQQKCCGTVLLLLEIDRYSWSFDVRCLVVPERIRFFCCDLRGCQMFLSLRKSAVTRLNWREVKMQTLLTLCIANDKSDVLLWKSEEVTLKCGGKGDIQWSLCVNFSVFAFTELCMPRLHLSRQRLYRSSMISPTLPSWNRLQALSVISLLCSRWLWTFV